MRLPRDISGADLAKALSAQGYRTTRQTGSHLRLSTEEVGQHHVTISNHDPIKVGTLPEFFLMWRRILESGATYWFNGSSVLEQVASKIMSWRFHLPGGGPLMIATADAPMRKRSTSGFSTSMRTGNRCATRTQFSSRFT
jgi:predicted RNA binding protein YcfA (HicA-like mRNA interferase family)